MMFAKKDTACPACPAVSPKELIKVALISAEDTATIKDLIEFCEKHYVDELSVNGVTIKRSIHLLPEDSDAEKKRKQAAIDLISYSAD